MIFRKTHNKENPFYMKNRAAANDKRLSFKAKGIHDYLMSKPDDWTVYETELAKASTDGLTAVRSGVKELMKYGYMEKVSIRDESGKIVRWETHVHESPQDGLSTMWETQNLDDPDSGESHTTKYLSLVNNDSLVSNDVQNSSSANASAAASADGTPVASLLPVQEKESTRAPEQGQRAKTTTSDAARRRTAATPTSQQELFQAVCDAVGWDANTCNKGQVAQMCGKLRRGGYTPADVRTWRADIWPQSFPGNKGGNPTVAQLGNGIAAIREQGQGGGVSEDIAKFFGAG